MIKKYITAGISAAFAVSVIMTPLSAGAAVTPGKTYNDTTGHWALQVVEKASAIGLMSGYPGGYFKPEGQMSRLEAISVIIRAMGLEDQALQTKAQGSGITMPPGMTWGEGYLVLAAQKGLLSKEYVPSLKYRDAITRAEVATLVAVALNIKGDPAKLTYSDNNSILELYKPYVAAVTEKNIMTGLGGNQFGPNQVMKRGQMAALMAKLAQDGWFKFGADRLIGGTVVSFDAATGLLVFKKADGTVLQKTLSEKPALFKNSSAATLEDIKYGTPIVVALKGSEAIQYLEVSSAAPPATSPVFDTTVTGRVTSTPGAAGTSITIADGKNSGKNYTLAPNLVVKDSTDTSSLSAVTAGKYITAQINSSQVSYIQILPTVSNQGTVQTISSGSLKISTGSGSYTYTLKSGETIVSGAAPKTGDTVKVISYQGKALEIIINSSAARVEGVITELDTDSSPGITLEDEDGGEKTFDITDDTAMTRDGDDIDLEDIMIGAEARIRYIAKEAIEIEITEDENITVEGEVVKVDESNERITIEQDSGNQFRLDVDRNCSYRNSANSTSVSDLGDIRKGWTVEITLDDSEATRIKVVDDDGNSDDEVEGTVTNLKLGSSTKITVKVNGSTKTYKITDDTDITKDGDDIDEDEIMIGAEVRIELDDDEATEIEVTNDTDDITVEGTIYSIDENNDRITIKQSNGAKFRLDVDRKCSFKDTVDTKNKLDELDDLETGWEVKLTLEDGEITTLKVTDK
ncbi:hypothetical protein DCCM_4680 [Desulfocucumis palustris]|uniref:SLH domain-containing protein n=1 Tax=Desulfocucumis palustris TaxID=1898651 RepID=A0A2L2XNK8_9FIRM|nr:S-layer homology domain-containing protein [Desulfocucumis palustris]GBF35551.1 hypothetical protein DCCM_4680 [Desulfocucumis palustris]